MAKRRFLILAIGAIAALLSVNLVLEWWLTRDVGGAACTEFSPTEAETLGLDFTPRFTEEKQIQKFEIRTARDQTFPDCFISNNAFRCSVDGPAMLRTKVWRDDRYFELGAQETMTVAGTEAYVLCGITARDAAPGG